MRSWLRFGRRPPPSRCHEAAQNLQAYLDGELDEGTAEVVAEHLEMCRRCGMELATYDAIKAVIGATGDGAPMRAEDAAAVDRLRAFADGLTARGG